MFGLSAPFLLLLKLSVSAARTVFGTTTATSAHVGRALDSLVWVCLSCTRQILIEMNVEARLWLGWKSAVVWLGLAAPSRSPSDSLSPPFTLRVSQSVSRSARPSVSLCLSLFSLC